MRVTGKQQASVSLGINKQWGISKHLGVMDRPWKATENIYKLHVHVTQPVAVQNENSFCLCNVLGLSRGLE